MKLAKSRITLTEEEPTDVPNPLPRVSAGLRLDPPAAVFHLNAFAFFITFDFLRPPYDLIFH